MFPTNDTQFKEHVITEVAVAGKGYHITFCDAGTLFVATCPALPRVDDTARLYGKGIGSPVRGLFVNGVEFYYRTEEEDKEHQQIMLYGADARDWLKRWDDGQGVWSIEMGGLGPGYEQAIQMTAAEILRFLLERKFHAETWSEDEQWKAARDEIHQHSFENTTISDLGLSGAQWGAALSLAVKLYRDGPRKIFTDEAVKDRKIQVSRDFPGMTC